MLRNRLWALTALTLLPAPLRLRLKCVPLLGRDALSEPLLPVPYKHHACSKADLVPGIARTPEPLHDQAGQLTMQRQCCSFLEGKYNLKRNVK
jgi:hypothetical protein